MKVDNSQLLLQMVREFDELTIWRNLMVGRCAGFAQSLASRFCGTPEQGYRQITDFIEYTGGVGSLLVITQGGSLDHNHTVDSLTLLAREIMPQLRDCEQPKARRTAAA